MTTSTTAYPSLWYNQGQLSLIQVRSLEAQCPCLGWRMPCSWRTTGRLQPLQQQPASAWMTMAASASKRYGREQDCSFEPVIFSLSNELQGHIMSVVGEHILLQGSIQAARYDCKCAGVCCEGKRHDHLQEHLKPLPHAQSCYSSNATSLHEQYIQLMQSLLLQGFKAADTSTMSSEAKQCLLAQQKADVISRRTLQPLSANLLPRAQKPSEGSDCAANSSTYQSYRTGGCSGELYVTRIND